MSTVTVNPGVCQFCTHIVAKANEEFEVELTITSDCAHIQQLAQQITRFSPFKELRLPMPANSIYQAAGTCKLHAACPVPSAILKAAEVAAGMALPADVTFTINKDQ